MCERIVECHPYTLFNVPERYKTLEMCERVVKEKPHILQYNFDWYVTTKMLENFDKIILLRSVMLQTM